MQYVDSRTKNCMGPHGTIYKTVLDQMELNETVRNQRGTTWNNL